METTLSKFFDLMKDVVKEASPWMVTKGMPSFGYHDIVITKGPWMVSAQWDIDRMSGGSCWDGGGASPCGGDPEPSTDALLEAIMIRLQPQITYLQFRRLSRLVEEKMTKDSTWLSAFYGNGATRGIKYIKLDDLFAILS